MNGTQACSLDSLVRELDASPSLSTLSSEWVCVPSTHSLSIEWAWGIIKRIEELAAKNYGEVYLFN